MTCDFEEIIGNTHSYEPEPELYWCTPNLAWRTGSVPSQPEPATTAVYALTVSNLYNPNDRPILQDIIVRVHSLPIWIHFVRHTYPLHPT